MKKYDKEKYLKLLRNDYKNTYEVAEEIINLKAILNLPKGTEMFLSDIHGEYEPFVHILNNGGGIIRSKIDDVFENSITQKERNALATLIYYPEEKLKLIKREIKDIDEWYRITLYRLILVAREVSSKYTRSKVRKAITGGFKYIIDELLHSQREEKDKGRYYREIIQTIIELKQAEAFIIEISNLIKRMAIDHLHIIGDIFDRGKHPELVIDRLMKFHSLDIQWGNHDILWMGAAKGNKACIATVIRICARYSNIEILEEAYGINIRPLSTFAMQTYANDECNSFMPKVFDSTKYDDSDKNNIAKIHKAITIIQFKLEGQMIKNHPEYNLNDRLLLDKMNLEKGKVNIYGNEYEITEKDFPTLNPKDVYELTSEEEEIIERLTDSFKHSKELKEHIDFLCKKGSVYTVFNDNLLFHGCIPMTEEGEFKEIQFCGKHYKGKAYLDVIEETINKICSNSEKDSKQSTEIMWFLWISPNSPFFGKDKMATFESYFVKDKQTHREIKNPYYTQVENEEICNKILKEFNIQNIENAHIINGHVPVKAKDGESPIRANGKLLVIDGGFAKSYSQKTGNAGYILTYNSNGLLLSQNKPFESIEKAIREEKDIISEIVVKKKGVYRKTVGDTDIGKKLKEQIDDLLQLLQAYKTGEIKEVY